MKLLRQEGETMQEPTVEQKREIIQEQLSSLSMQYYRFKIVAKVQKDLGDDQQVAINAQAMAKCQEAADIYTTMLEELKALLD